MKRRKRRKAEFSKGELNRIVDAIFHPLVKKDSRFIWLDTAAHALVEQNPSETIRKFCKYNLPKLMKPASKKNLNHTHGKRRRKRRHPK